MKLYPSLYLLYQLYGIEETGQTLNTRFRQHVGLIRNQTNIQGTDQSLLYQHFLSGDHRIEDMKVLILRNTSTLDKRKESEMRIIRLLKTLAPAGLN
jgi:hypothetical protein